MFTGQRVRWEGAALVVDQNKAIEELREISFDKTRKDTIACTPSLHTEYRSVLGSLNWLQSRTQFHIVYPFSRCASASASPTMGDIRAINKLVRKVKSEPVKLHFWPLKGKCRIIGFPDASCNNNSDKSSQRGQAIFLAEPRKTVNMEPNDQHPRQRGLTTTHGSTKGSLIDYESHKIARTTLSTTVAELYSLMKCYGTCLFLGSLGRHFRPTG